MASAFRILRYGSLKNFGICFKGNSSLLRPAPLQTSKIVSIHTSKKSKEEVPTLIDAIADRTKSPEEPISYRTPENWVSYGFSDTDIVEDSTMCHMMYFLFITLIMCGYTFFIMYMPDNRMIEWTKREAFFELRRREQEGLPLVDKDLVPLESFDLPTDDELGDVEITI